MKLPRVNNAGARTNAIYALALAVAVAIWFIAIRSPLWLDETGSYWMISRGISKIWPARFISLGFPAYYYILWLATKILGTNELALRVPSVLAMLGATYLLYQTARELFDREVALIAVIIFCVNPIVIFSSIDARPYAFGLLIANAAIFILIRLRNSNSSGLAALFGLAAAGIVYFHYLFAVILPAFVVCFFIVKIGDRKTLWRQFAIAAAAFALAFLPLIPGLRYLFRTSAAHVCEVPPTLGDLARTLLPGWLPFVFVAVALVSLVIVASKASRQVPPARPDFLRHANLRRAFLCASLALIPVLFLYGVSKGTSIQIFAVRHRLIAVPGIALCWALVIGMFPSRAIRLAFCVALVAATTFTYLHTPFLREHDDTWKYALDVAEKNASADNAPVLMCSPFVEGGHLPTPLNSAAGSRFFAPISYYKLSVPVVPMPYALNAQAMQIGAQFLEDATRKRQRFLALGDKPSYGILDWLAQNASGAFKVRKLGVFDQTEVLEFMPRAKNEAR